MRILKFGGTSVATAERIREASAIVAAAVEVDLVVVVVSALAGVTNALVEVVERVLAGDGAWRSILEDLGELHRTELVKIGPGEHQDGLTAIDTGLQELSRLVAGIGLIGECPTMVKDRILAVGERLSAPLMAEALRGRGLAAQVVDGSEMIVAERTTDGAEVNVTETARRSSERLSDLDRGTVPVVTGFLASDSAGRTITLGRGGSDLSATVLGAALSCDQVEIWTDVDGVMSAPPRAVRSARTLPVLSVPEAAQLAFFGAKVLHPTCLAVLDGHDIPVLIRNTRRPEGNFTEVRHQCTEQIGVRAVAAVEDVAVFEVKRPLGCDEGWGHRMDLALAAIQGQILVASRASADRTWALVATGPLGDVVADCLISHRVDQAVVRRPGSLVALVGGAVLTQPWVVGRALEALGRHNVTVNGLFAGSTPCAVSVLVSTDELGSALEIVHEALMLGSRADASLKRKEVSNEEHETQGRNPRCNRQRRSKAHQPAA